MLGGIDTHKISFNSSASVVAHDDDPDAAVTLVTSFPATGSATKSVQTGCPTVTVTGELCSTCPVPACLGIATVTQSCGCPAVMPTVTLNFPCASSCSGVWCSTSYATATATCGGGGEGTMTHSSSLPTNNGNSTISGTRPPSPTVSPNAAGRLAVPFWGW
jgi:hypothetical protein